MTGLGLRIYALQFQTVIKIRPGRAFGFEADFIKTGDL
jgi:hypothetical protein